MGLTLRIKLGAGPLRIVTIADEYTFAHLHRLFCLLFKWDNSHLHRFEVPKESSLPPSADPVFSMLMQSMPKSFVWISNPMSFLRMGGTEERNEADVSLSFGFKNVGDCVEYEYDFGDSWRAKIDLINIESKRVRASLSLPLITVIGGRGPVIPEFGGNLPMPYNANQLNQQLGQMNEFVYHPLNVAIGDNHDEDDDLQQPNESIDERINRQAIKLANQVKSYEVDWDDDDDVHFYQSCIICLLLAGMMMMQRNRSSKNSILGIGD